MLLSMTRDGRCVDGNDFQCFIDDVCSSTRRDADAFMLGLTLFVC